ncbi:MAG: HipA domain-containing protein [Lachnospiraceae bacterium]|nr:HipA domain-containing protein [Lachnospiraceae bacterium]
MRCLCCNKEIKNPTEYEIKVGWHVGCIRKFFGEDSIPQLDISEKQLEELASTTVSKGLTVPGVQKKLSLHLDKEEKGSRFTIVDYPTGYILKPQSEDYEALPEAEFLSMKMAEIVGIKTVPNGLIYLDGKYAYITKRIDRHGDKLYAMEDFCQLSGRLTADKYKGSYEGCGRVINKYSKNVGVDKTEFFYRLLYCFVTGNSDMHLKNFSLIERAPASRVFGLSPAYDMLPVNVILPHDKDQMALSLNGKKRNIRKKDFIVLADNLGISEKTANKMILQLAKYRERMLEEIKISYMPDEMKKDMGRLFDVRMEGFLE